MPPKRKTRTGGKGGVRVEAGKGDAGGEIRDVGAGAVPAPVGLTAEDVESALARYSDHISQLAGEKPDGQLQELDAWRLGEFPDLLRSRNPAWLDKEELQRLMEWKLTRGSFRPTLRGLIAQNTPAKVKSSTQEAFTALSKLSSLFPELSLFRALFKSLCASLKGVGPATASLVLSVYDDWVPFMSDEAYIWVMYADEGKRKKDVKYTEKGYLDYATKMREVAKRVGRTPADLEKVGWVLGREWIAGAELRGNDTAAEAETREAEASPPGDESPGLKRPKRQKR